MPRLPLRVILGAVVLMAFAALALYATAGADVTAGDDDTAASRADVAVPPVLHGPAASLRRYLNDLGYRLEDIRAGREAVPRLRLAALPADMHDLADIDARKRLFLRLLLPLVLHANEQVAADRGKLLALASRMRAGRSLSDAENCWLARLAAAYGTDAQDIGSLIRRVDTVPTSLVLGQAALESGWGTSRFAREGNALFGQRVFSDTADGLEPLDPAEGPSFKVRKFETPQESVNAYLHNLNTHPAYSAFRQLRASIRGQGAVPDSLALAQTLHAYSEKGADYVSLLGRIIRSNDLTALDKAGIANADETVTLPRA